MPYKVQYFVDFYFANWAFFVQGFQGKMGPPGPPGVVGPQVSFKNHDADFLITDAVNHIRFHNNTTCPFFFSLHLPPPRVHQERPAPWASAATPDPQVHPESRDFLVHQERRAPRETLAPPEALAKTDPQDWEVSLEREDCLELLWVWPEEILCRSPGRCY